jgi:hypothetical protein
MPSAPSDARLKQDLAEFRLALSKDLVSQVTTLAQDLRDCFAPSEDDDEVAAAMQAWTRAPMRKTEAARTVSDFIETTLGAAEKVATDKGHDPTIGFQSLKNRWESLSDAFVDWENGFPSKHWET